MPHLLGIDPERFTFPYQGLDMRLTGVEPTRVLTDALGSRDSSLIDVDSASNASWIAIIRKMIAGNNVAFQLCGGADFEWWLRSSPRRIQFMIGEQSQIVTLKSAIARGKRLRNARSLLTVAMFRTV